MSFQSRFKRLNGGFCADRVWKLVPETRCSDREGTIRGRQKTTQSDDPQAQFNRFLHIFTNTNDISSRKLHRALRERYRRDVFREHEYIYMVCPLSAVVFFLFAHVQMRAFGTHKSTIDPYHKKPSGSLATP